MWLLEPAHPPLSKTLKIPQFFIEAIENKASFLVALRCSIPTIRAEMKNKFIKINVDEIEYGKLQKTLQQEDIYYRSFLLEKKKHQKIFIRGLPANTIFQQIKDWLDLE